MTYATCECGRQMTPRGGCRGTHVKNAAGETARRVRVGEGADWSSPECHDCNARDGQPHHVGCDAERCPKCGQQMLGCLGDPDETLELDDGRVIRMGGCGWTEIAWSSARAAAR